jgi:hypothetical protein
MCGKTTFCCCFLELKKGLTILGALELVWLIIDIIQIAVCVHYRFFTAPYDYFPIVVNPVVIVLPLVISWIVLLARKFD